MRRIIILFLLCMLCANIKSLCNNCISETDAFTPQNHVIRGMQMWYAPLIGSNEKKAENKKRFTTELDTLKALGVNTINVLAGAKFVPTPTDSLHLTAGHLTLMCNDEHLFKGLDFVLNELHKRQMKAIVSISQQWTDASDTAAISSFIKKMSERKNCYSKVLYQSDTTIVAWQICDAPYTQTKDSLQLYVDWCAKQAKLLKDSGLKQPIAIVYAPLDVTSNSDEQMFQNVMSYNCFDLVLVAFNPYRMRWVMPGDLYNALGKIYLKASDKIQTYMRIAQGLDKPFALCDCAYPRTAMFTRPNTNTDSRDAYFSYLLNLFADATQGDYAQFKGIVFNGWGGNVMQTKDMWQNPYDFTAEYPNETKGRYSIFSKDTSTLNVLRSFWGK